MINTPQTLAVVSKKGSTLFVVVVCGVGCWLFFGVVLIIT